MGYFGWEYNWWLFPFVFRKPLFWARDRPWCAFTAKTTTLNGNTGFMPMKQDGVTPAEWIPKSVWVSWRRDLTVNSVGLSGPPARALFETGDWQARTEPFMLSFMSIRATKGERIDELRQYVAILREFIPEMQAPFALQINFSCPNVGVKHDPRELVGEIEEALRIASVLGVPLVPKVVCTITARQLVEIGELPYCDAVCTTNTLPWGTYPERIDWQRIFGTAESPLVNLDPKSSNPNRGGASGWPLLPINCGLISEARKLGMETPIIASGGVAGPRTVEMYRIAGANHVEWGSSAARRPFTTRRGIHAAHRIFA